MAVISIKMSEVEFVGQTKDQLGSSSARSAVDISCADKMARFLEENPQVGTECCSKKSIQASKAREAARKARDEIRSGKKRSESSNLGGKLSPAQSKDFTRTELFIVEGTLPEDQRSRDVIQRYQAILPLKGKPMNPEKAKPADILRTTNIRRSLQPLVQESARILRLEDSNYCKIIIMTDADTDGAHIQVLLLTFFIVI